MSREKLHAAIPSWYNPWLHLILPSLFGIVVIGICFDRLGGVGWVDLLILPIWILLLFIFEWVVHRWVLHRSTFGLRSIYRLHMEHHGLYGMETMSLVEFREIYYILMPVYAIGLVFGLVLPLGFFLGWLISLNCGYLIVISSLGFFLAYEWLHLSYHMPVGSFVGRMSLVRHLRRFHRLHHNSLLMNRYNFNVTLPLVDWMMGTLRK